MNPKTAIRLKLIHSIWVVMLMMVFGMPLPILGSRFSPDQILIAYDWQIQTSSAYDGNSLSEFDYDCAAMLVSGEKEKTTVGTTGLLADFAEFLAAERTAAELPQFYIENGVRRSLASREAGLGDISATIFREGQPPTTTTLRLDQLFSPKPEIPLDSRFLNIQPPIRVPIQVQPLGVPGQLPTVPLNQVRIVPPGG